MSKYRNDVNEILTEGRWTFWKFFPSILLAILVIGGIATGTRYLGMWGETAIERVVFTNSYQRSASLNERIAINEASLVEIERKLTISDLDEGTRKSLEAQAAAARIRIATAKAQQ